MTCAHLDSAPLDVATGQREACTDCLAEGTRWVHLRACLTCGHVGCCDSSPRKHATAHWTSTSHPVVRSVEPGEAWRWCYADSRLAG